MNISTLLLLLLSFTTLYSTRADQVLLLDTRTATTELNWKTWSNQEERDGWLEETTYSEEQKVNHRIFSICDVGHADIENWLLVPAVDPRSEAAQIQIEIGYNIAKCEKLLVLSKRQLAACRETMKLYALTLQDQDQQLGQDWFNDTRWEYLETLVVKSERESDTKHVLTVSYPVENALPSTRVHFALKNTGACVAVLYIKVYYNFCAEASYSFTYLPRTLPAGDVNSVVTVVGNCVSNASPAFAADSALNNLSARPAQVVAQPPTFICKPDGVWQSVGASRCECNPGYIPSLKTNLCTACGIGTYKAVRGSGECRQCPEHSTSHRLGSMACECDAGYERLSNETISHSCQRRELERNPELVVIEERFGGGSAGARIFEGSNSNYGSSETSTRTNDWIYNLFSTQQFWMWLIVCIASTLILCCVLLTVSRYSVFNRKQLSDMDALDNYKQEIISPDYSRSFNGQLSVMPGLASHKSNLPLIPTYNTTQRNHMTLGVNMMSTNRFKPYVDPTTYEDPRMALDEFTNEINVECVTVTRVIGAGEFGEVCSGRMITEDAYGQHHEYMVAVKTLLPGSSSKAKSDFLMEALIMGQFEHENVIRLLGVVTKTEPVMILTEYMINGSLDSFLKANDNKIETFQLVHILHGIACGMKYLTDKNYVHRDLAARNVLVDDRLICKIADFGLSRGLTDSLGEQEYTTQNSEKIPIRWTAPEAIAHSKYTAASDVWSYGVVMWEVFSYGDRPYGNWTNHKVIDEVRTGYRLAPSQNTPPRLGELMNRCWNMERHSRPTFGEIVAELNSYINDFLWRPSPTRFINPPYSSGR